MAVEAAAVLVLHVPALLLLLLPTTAAEPADWQQQGCVLNAHILLRHSM
jgi:hypothetical protein